MARNSTAIKALEKALQQLKTQEGSTGSGPKTSAKTSASGEEKSVAYLIKESRHLGDGLIAFCEEEKNRAQSFLNTISAVESGNYAPKRGGGRKSAGRSKNPTQKEPLQTGEINDKK